MITEVANIKIAGEAQEDLLDDILEIEVEEDVAKSDVFRVRFALRTGPDGNWEYLSDSRFRVWQRFSIDAGFPDDTHTIMDGYITHVDASLSNDENDAYVEVSGIDTSCLMDLQDRQLAWSNKKDNEIAEQIFRSYGLEPHVEDTVVRHEEKTATILQTDPDFLFLRKLAARNGFECFVKGNKGFFCSPAMKAPPQKVLAIQFGGETNLTSLKIKVDGTAATQVEIRRIDPIAKETGVEKLAVTPLRELGIIPLSHLQVHTPGGRTLLKQQISAYPEEMKARLRGAFSAADQFLRADGEIDGRVYQAVLRTSRLVTIKGAGADYSGLYYVTRVTHLFQAEGYTQRFEAYRNGIGLTGREDFSSPPLLAAGVSAVAGAAASGGSVVSSLVGTAASGASVVTPQQSAS